MRIFEVVEPLKPACRRNCNKRCQDENEGKNGPLRPHEIHVDNLPLSQSRRLPLLEEMNPFLSSRIQ